MLFKRSRLPVKAEPIESYIKFSANPDGDAKVSVSFSEDTDPDQFGMLLAMVNKGLLSKHIETAVSEFSQDNSLDDHGLNVLKELDKYNTEIDDGLEDNIDQGEFFAEHYPAMPAWGDPEITELFDEEAIDDSPRKILWQYLESRGNEIDELEEEPVSTEDQEGKTKNLYAVDGVSGLLNESQFRRLQDSEKPEYELPKQEMWIGSTNFQIGLNAVKAVANAQGVEFVKIVGRYSFVIAIGRFFEFKDIRKPLEERMGIEYAKQLES